MSLGILSILALLPIAAVFVLIVLFKWPAAKAMPLAYITTCLIAFGVWKVPWRQVLAASIDGLFTAASILYIVLGAILLLSIQQESGSLQAIKRSMFLISPDRRIQAIIIAFLLGSFIEGSAGFGTPAAVAAPLLVAIGFPAMAAVLVALIIQSTPVSFGAIGTPILIGIQAGLSGQEEVVSYLAAHHLNLSIYLKSIASKVALIHGITGTFIPLILVVMMTRFFGRKEGKQDILPIVPFAIFAGVSFTIPFTLTGVFLGPEFPSLIGSLAGLAIVLPLAKVGFLVPRNRWDFPPKDTWPPEWSGQKLLENTNTKTSVSIFRAWLPYMLVAVLLLISRLWPTLNHLLSSVKFLWSNLFGTSIQTSLQPLYMPGFLFLIVAVLTAILQKLSLSQVKKAVNRSFKTLVGPAIALSFAVPMVKVFINSGVPGKMDKMPVVLATGAAVLAGKAWVVLAPVIGALGAFIAGSNTFSNLMFSLFQFTTALKTGTVPSVIVALQTVGGAAGNMICIHNVVAASAVVGLLGKEGLLIRKTLLPMAYYLAMAAIIGAVMLHVFRV